ncbi:MULTISPECIES: SOS response-associated peptidase [unclassified Thioalkalivibrio]
MTRYSATSELAMRYFQVPVDEAFDAPRYNVAPGTDLEAFGAGVETSTTFRPMFWAFGRIGWTTVLARSDKVASSPYFRSAFARRRCSVLADGWDEWRRTDDGKQPYYINLAEDAPQDILMMVGIWEPIADGGACCAIITEPASERLSRIHDREPLVLDAECRWDWLDPERTDRGGHPSRNRPSESGNIDLPAGFGSRNGPVESDVSLIEVTSGLLMGPSGRNRAASEGVASLGSCVIPGIPPNLRIDSAWASKAQTPKQRSGGIESFAIAGVQFGYCVDGGGVWGGRTL